MRPSGRSTLQTVAKALGVSRMTVSLALRDDPQISAETRKRVKVEAENQGFRVNPLVGEWMAQVRRGQKQSRPPALAYVSAAGEQAHKANPHLAELLSGIRTHVETLLFQFHVFCGSGLQTDYGEIVQYLQQAGVLGLILGPFPENACPPQLPWERFATVKIGYSIRSPAHHTVTDEHLESTIEALRCYRSDYSLKQGLWKISFQQGDVEKKGGSTLKRRGAFASHASMWTLIRHWMTA